MPTEGTRRNSPASSIAAPSGAIAAILMPIEAPRFATTMLTRSPYGGVACPLQVGGGVRDCGDIVVVSVTVRFDDLVKVS